MRNSARHGGVEGRRELSVVAPAYNEERRLPALLERAAAADSWVPASLSLRDLIVVDDGSEDETVALLDRSRGLEGRLRVLELARHRGKGAAVRAGLEAASGDLVLLTDVDMSSPLVETAKLLAALDDGGFDLVIGSRAVPGAELAARQHPLRELLGKTCNRLIRRLTGIPYRDTQCGFKLLRRDVARRLAEHQRIDGYLYDAELCLIALQLGFRVAEVPVRWSHDPDSRVRLLRSAPGVARDLLMLRRLARRPLERQPEGTHTPTVDLRR